MIKTLKLTNKQYGNIWFYTLVHMPIHVGKPLHLKSQFELYWKFWCAWLALIVLLGKNMWTPLQCRHHLNAALQTYLIWQIQNFMTPNSTLKTTGSKTHNDLDFSILISLVSGLTCLFWEYNNKTLLLSRKKLSSPF